MSKSIYKSVDFEQFKRDVSYLNLENPVTAIANELVISKGNVSSYINGKIPLAPSFLEKFYNKFNISPGVGGPADESKSTDWQAKYIQLLEQENANKQRVLESFGPSLAKLIEGHQDTHRWLRAHVQHEAIVRAKGDPKAVQNELEQISRILLDLAADKI
ncbi:hypothetical protein [Flavihumibacter petaseus]|uniref:Uncharacterized protein n=1 Tax=Flavihumibacter petaseus NBRC 106054 TaxID=1220578 RepID=A0A0E9N1V0_9BACT|nr:hypothetical protein [Flavihumibacter petaseus]GAO43753.1 hypothetical protein FPE01S_02_08590 [Flavihumibacter petaseus NBRC 106054]